jgi:hypothetical protein
LLRGKSLGIDSRPNFDLETNIKDSVERTSRLLDDDDQDEKQWPFIAALKAYFVERNFGIN